MSKPPLIQTKNLSHKFDYVLFEDLCIDFYEQECIAIIGQSGCGKSSFINILSSFLKPTSGTITFCGKNLYNLKDNEILKIRREHFGLIFQSHYLFRGFSVKENLQISSLLSNKKIDNDILENLGIAHTLNQGVGELSGGEQQRLSIARILNKKPKVIFADEPTGNLDKQNSKNVVKMLIKFAKTYNSLLILVSHDNELALTCDKIYELKNKKLELIKGGI